MLQNAYLVAKIGADIAENWRNFAENNWQLPYGSTALRVHYPTGGEPPGRRGRGRARGGGGRLRRGAAGEPPRPGKRRQPPLGPAVVPFAEKTKSIAFGPIYLRKLDHFF